MKDLNKWAGDRMRVDITGAFGVLGKIIMDREGSTSLLKRGHT